MSNQLKFLYSQIKEGKISQDDAIKQIKKYKTRYNPGLKPPPSPGLKKAYNAGSASGTGILTVSLADKVQAALLQMASQLLKVRSEDIDPHVELKECGFDPVTLSEFVNRLNQGYNLELTPTLFLEHPTLHSFVGYLLENFLDIFIKRFQPDSVKTPSRIGGSKIVPGIEQELLQEKATNYFKKLLSSVINLPVHRIEADAPLGKYGIDSIIIMKLTNQLEKAFGSLSKTLFFEYQNIRELTGYFLESHREPLTALLGIEENAAASTQNSGDAAVVTAPVKSTFNSIGRSRFATISIKSREEKSAGALDIAIIGLSGRYPQAKTIQEFWENLRDGKDCIIEIPKERWDHSLYFDENKNKRGKTYSKWGGFLEGVDEFDPLFFNISPLEAEIMDPQSLKL